METHVTTTLGREIQTLLRCRKMQAKFNNLGPNWVALNTIEAQGAYETP
jgi:hypothetical protein